MAPTGSAGIGISTTPAERFEIRDPATSYLKFTRTSDVLGPVGGIKFDLAGTEVGRIETERIVAGNRFSAMKFMVYNSTNSGSITEVMRLNEDGLVGVGTPAPLGRFHVQGIQAANKPYFLVTQSGVPATDAYVQFSNPSNDAGIFVPQIKGRSNAANRGMAC